MTQYRRTPRSLMLALDRAQRGWAPATALAAIQGAWADLVGAAVAEQAVPVRLTGGVLTVSCSASVWAQELDLMGPAIIARLHGRLGHGEVTRIRCVTGL
jgi:predicted nucleic acid-binding Zn ribbon protein